MRALVVVVQAILMDDRLQVALVDDQYPVEAFSTAAPDPALRMFVSSGAISRVKITRAPCDWKMRFASRAKFLSRSWIKTLSLIPSSSSFQLRLRACWVTQAAFGFEVQLASKTRRDAR